MTKTRRTSTVADADAANAHFRAVIDRDQLTSASALVVFCDDQARPTNQWHILDCDVDPTPSECGGVLNELISRLADGPAPTGLALGLTRAGGEEVQPYDRAWFRGYHRICHLRGLTPYGVYIVTRIGARPVHIDDAA
jgi:hypothetical protein